MYKEVLEGGGKWRKRNRCRCLWWRNRDAEALDYFYALYTHLKITTVKLHSSQSHPKIIFTQLCTMYVTVPN
jgi:hypothetical protein